MQSRRERIRRREFLAIGVAATVAGATTACTLGHPVNWRFFSIAQARTVGAICEQIIPADQDSGANDAGVVHFIDLQLTKHYRKHRQAYIQGLSRVDESSTTAFGKPFAELASEQQIEILRQTEKKDSAFFNLILSHTMQGFYGDPRHGGNQNGACAKMLGIPFPPVRGRDHFEKPRVTPWPPDQNT
jgi:gluconate 2-dehydrogenase gamma chain